MREQNKLGAELLESADLVIVKALLPANSGFAGYSPRSLDLDRRYGLAV